MTNGAKISAADDGSIVATYIDGNGKLVETKLKPYCVKGEPATALTVVDPFHRVRVSEQAETVKKFDAAPEDVRNKYVALIEAQSRGDNGSMSVEQKKAYCEAVSRHGLSPEDPYATIVRDHYSGANRGLEKVYGVGNRPVDASLAGDPVIVSFLMQAGAYEGGNLYAGRRLQATYEAGDTRKAVQILKDSGMPEGTARESAASSISAWQINASNALQLVN